VWKNRYQQELRNDSVYCTSRLNDIVQKTSKMSAFCYASHLEIIETTPITFIIVEVRLLRLLISFILFTQTNAIRDKKESK